MKDLARKARKVIEKIRYMNIASVTKNEEPWNTPVSASFDKKLNFYWASWKENQHSKNLKHNHNVFITIYDSTVGEGKGFGVYMQGVAREAKNLIEIMTGISTHYRRAQKKARAVKEFLKGYPRRIYKFIPKRVWVNGDGEVKGNFVDIRKELRLKDLINAK